MFDVAPPGQAVMITTPMATSGGKPGQCASATPVAGSRSICPKSPTIAARGISITRRKSASLSSMPMLIMITNRIAGTASS